MNNYTGTAGLSQDCPTYTELTHDGGVVFLVVLGGPMGGSHREKSFSSK